MKIYICDHCGEQCEVELVNDYDIVPWGDTYAEQDTSYYISDCCGCEVKEIDSKDLANQAKSDRLFSVMSDAVKM